jgi:hypothetical protein
LHLEKEIIQQQTKESSQAIRRQQKNVYIRLLLLFYVLHSSPTGCVVVHELSLCILELDSEYRLKVESGKKGEKKVSINEM